MNYYERLMNVKKLFQQQKKLKILDVKSFLYAFKGSNCLYELKGDLSSVMLKEIFHDTFEDLYGKLYKRDWTAKLVYIS